MGCAYEYVYVLCSPGVVVFFVPPLHLWIFVGVSIVPSRLDKSDVEFTGWLRKVLNWGAQHFKQKTDGTWQKRCDVAWVQSIDGTTPPHSLNWYTSKDSGNLSLLIPTSMFDSNDCILKMKTSALGTTAIECYFFGLDLSIQACQRNSPL